VDVAFVSDRLPICFPLASVSQREPNNIGEGFVVSIACISSIATTALEVISDHERKYNRARKNGMSKVVQYDRSGRRAFCG
jgi:hypothetical protein